MEFRLSNEDFSRKFRAIYLIILLCDAQQNIQDAKRQDQLTSGVLQNGHSKNLLVQFQQ